MNLAQSSLPSEGHRLFLQLRSELQAVLCTRSRPTQPLLEPDWRSSSDLTCISSSTRTWDRAAGERDQRSGEIELAEKNRIEPFVLLDLAVLVIAISLVLIFAVDVLPWHDALWRSIAAVARVA
jgi:hypothetical protein